MSKVFILIIFIFVLWFVIVKPDKTGYNKSGYQGGVSKGGSSHSSGGGKF